MPSTILARLRERTQRVLVWMARRAGWPTFELRSVTARLVAAIAAATAIVTLGAITLEYFRNAARHETNRLAQLDAYVGERAKGEARVFQSAASLERAAIRAFSQRIALVNHRQAAAYFDEAFPLQADGTRRSRPDLFEGRRESAGGYAYGIGAFIADAEALTLEDKAQLWTAYQIVRDFGAAAAPEIDNFYFFTPQNRVIIFAPTRPDRLIFYRSSAPPSFDFQDEEFAFITSLAENPSAATRCTSLRPIVYDTTGSTWTTGCHTPMDIGGERLGAWGTSITLEEGLRSSLADALPGTTNTIIDRNGALIAHPELLGHDLRSGYGAEVAERLRIAAIHEALRADPRSHGVLRGVRGSNYVAFARLPGPDWVLLIFSPKSATAVATLQFGLGLLFAGAIAIALLVSIAYLFMRRSVIAPLKQLTGASYDDAAIVDSTPLTAIRSRTDEIGELARALEAKDRRVSHLMGSLEDQVQARTSELAHALEAKSEFLANMSHEIRTPLNSIIGFSRLLATSNSLPPAERRNAEIVVSASQALLAIVNDILNLSALEAGTLLLEAKPFSPAQMIEQVVDEMQLQAKAKGISLTSQLDATLAQNLVGDKGRLRQVIVNLVSNAIKFTDVGCVSIRAAMRRQDKHVLAFAVTDTGLGIPADLHAKLFTRFSQLDSSPSRRFGGTGLGLAISKRLIDLMGGEIGVVSREGEGSTFWFEVPLPVAAETNEEPQPRYAPSLALSSLEVLIVDDVETNLALLQILLEGHKLDTAASGEEALRKTAAKKYDIVLMDIQMPGMDGFVATRAMRANGVTTPIIALTAHVLPGQVEACAAAGMDDHLGKPIDPDALQGILIKWSRQSVARPRLAGGQAIDDLRRRFVARCEDDLVILSGFLNDGSATEDSVRSLIHRLAGSAAVFGFADLSRVALAADQAFCDADGTPMEDLARLRTALEAACAESVAA